MRHQLRYQNYFFRRKKMQQSCKSNKEFLSLQFTIHFRVDFLRGQNHTYSPALRFQIWRPQKQTRVPKYTRVTLTLVYSSTLFYSGYRAIAIGCQSVRGCSLPKQTRAPKQASTLALEVAEVDKIQLAKVPENRYDYTLPIFSLFCVHG